MNMPYKPDMEITYEVQYQHPGDPTWYVLEEPLYEHAVPGGHHSATSQLSEADDVARALAEGRSYPLKPNRSATTNVVAAEVLYRIYASGTARVYGTPNVSRETETEGKG